MVKNRVAGICARAAQYEITFELDHRSGSSVTFGTVRDGSEMIWLWVGSELGVGSENGRNCVSQGGF